MAVRPFRFLRDMLDLDETSKTAGKVIAVNDDADGYELVDAAAASGGAPTTATYIVQTADATLSAEQALADLATGIVKNTTTTGVLSIAAEGTDYYGPSGTDVALADGGTGASLADPGADRIMFWDDSESSTAYLQAGSGLSITGTVVAASVTATMVSISDSGNDFTATDVEGALAELQADHETDAQNLADHIADASDAHDASAISVLDTAANFMGTDVEAVLAELQDNIDAGGGGGGSITGEEETIVVAMEVFA